MTRSSAEPDEEPPTADAAVERAAALDDYLGGFAAAISAAPDPGGSDTEAGSVAGLASGEFVGLLGTMLLLRQAAAADGVVPAAGPAAPPRVIGRHTILRLAGEGGFATVWEGFDTVLLRAVAVKLRRPELLLSESARRRFVREAEIAARLVHPHIVTIFEVGEDQGREFIAAEFCSGGSLAGWLERHPGPLEPRTAAGLVRALAGGVAFAHAAGVIHRDIKPGNVLLVPAAAGSEPLLPDPAGRGLSVKLGDFGLGKLAEEGDPADLLTQLTRTGTAIGTPAWMAPEQLDRTFGGIGPATDVHALGLLLQRLLTGRDLRGGRTDAETYRQVLLEEPVSADRVVRGVPPDLAAVALKALAKQPRDRYASAEALAADLDRWLTGRPTLARPISPAGRAARWVRRRPVLTGLAAIAVAASLAAGWAGLARMREATRTAAREADLRRQRAVAELRRGFEALRAGNVAEASGKLGATRGLDSAVADSLAGRWLLRRTHGEQAILLGDDPLAGSAPGGAGPPRDLYEIALSATGDTAAVAAADGRVHLLRRLTAGPSLTSTSITSVQAHEEVNAVAFSADGRALATAGQDGRLRWWHVTEGGLDPAGEAAIDAGPLYAAAFSPDGRVLATGGEDRVVRLVRLDSPADPEELVRLEAPPGKSPEIESALFVGETRLAVCCGDLIVLIDAERGRLVREFERATGANRKAVLGSLTLSPDGRRLAACGTDAKAHVWDIETGKLVRSLPSHPAWVQGCCFSPEGSQLATACRDGGVRVFDLTAGRMLNRLLGHVGRVWSIAWEPSGTLLTAGADGTVRRWDPACGFDAAATRGLAVHGGPITAVVAAPAARPGPTAAGTGTVYAVAHGGPIQAVETRSGRVGPVAVAASRTIWQADVDPAGSRIAVCSWDARPPEIFSLAADSPGAAEPTEVTLPVGTDAREPIAAWTPAGGLAIRTIDGSLCWCPADFATTRRIAALEGVVHGLAVAPAGPPRVAAFGDRVAILPLPRSPAFQPRPGEPLVLPVSIETTAVGWSPDAAVIACGSRTGAVQVFDATTGGPRGSLAPHEQMVNAILFSPHGRNIISADRECVRISDALTLTTFDELRPGIEIAGICLTADGTRLVIAGKAAEPGPGDPARLLVMELSAP